MKPEQPTPDLNSEELLRQLDVAIIKSLSVPAWIIGLRPDYHPASNMSRSTDCLPIRYDSLPRGRMIDTNY